MQCSNIAVIAACHLSFALILKSRLRQPLTCTKQCRRYLGYASVVSGCSNVRLIVPNASFSAFNTIVGLAKFEQTVTLLLYRLIMFLCSTFCVVLQCLCAFRLLFSSITRLMTRRRVRTVELSRFFGILSEAG